jgi:hypothetical protein
MITIRLFAVYKEKAKTDLKERLTKIMTEAKA